MGDKGVGWLFTIRVDPADDDKVEGLLGEIFDAMEKEEFPGGGVITYTAYRDPNEPGKWVMFEHFTDEGSDRHAKGPLVRDPGGRLMKLLIAPRERVQLEPVILRGCGEPIVTDEK